MESGIACAAEPGIRSPDKTIAVSFGIISSTVGGTIVDDDYFKIGIVQALKMPESFPQCGAAIVCAHDNGNLGPLDTGREWYLVECMLHCRQRRFRATVSAREAEIPILDIAASTVPFVGPGKNEYAGRAPFKCTAHLPGKRPRLLLFSIATAVQPNFGHQ